MNMLNIFWCTDQENLSDLEPGDSNLSSRIQAISNLVSSCLGSPPVSSIPAPVHASTPLVHLFSGWVFKGSDRVDMVVELSV